MDSTFLAFWNALCEKNFQLKDDSVKMEITAKTFRDWLEKAYKKGVRDKVILDESLKKLDNKSNCINVFEDLFLNIL